MITWLMIVDCCALVKPIYPKLPIGLMAIASKLRPAETAAVPTI